MSTLINNCPIKKFTDFQASCETECNNILLPLFWLTNKNIRINRKARDLFCSIRFLIVNISLCGSTFYMSTKPIETEMKLFKLRTIALSYSERVDLYCSDKGYNIILQHYITSMFTFGYTVTKSD